MVTAARTNVRHHDLRSLSELDVAALGDLYHHGEAPTRVDALEGHPRGRMLAIRALDHGLRGRMLRKLAGAESFPWNGKSFQGRGPTGTGINRVSMGGNHKLFPFRTRIQPSVVDDQPCIVLDYDLPDNPGMIRAIHDELREIEPGLYLGPAMLKAKAGPAFVLWFALDTSVQSTPNI